MSKFRKTTSLDQHNYLLRVRMLMKFKRHTGMTIYKRLDELIQVGKYGTKTADWVNIDLKNYYLKNIR